MLLKYYYDLVGRLIREDNRDLGKTFEFVYDKAGNILKRNEYAFTEGVLPVNHIVSTYNYIYDTTHKNRLLSYNGEADCRICIQQKGMNKSCKKIRLRIFQLGVRSVELGVVEF